jgi:hypothetical protein
MAHGNTHDETGKLDLVPMIDCVMLLLLFFILTSSFRSEEQHIASLLSAEGQGPGTPMAQPEIVRIVVLPGEGRNARVRIGGGEELTLDDATLAQPGGPAVEAAVEAFHAALAAKLAVYEKGGARTDQTPVEIHCATRLPWRDAIVVYDAVRAYEQARLPDPSVALSDQRSVAFGAPTVRRSGTDNESDELGRLERLR